MEQNNFEAMLESLDNEMDYEDGDGEDEEDITAASVSYNNDTTANSHYVNSTSSFNYTGTSSAADITNGGDGSSATHRDIFYGENYFDLNDILSQSQRLAVKFQRTIPKLGFLDPSSTAEDPNIVKGTKLELPLWIVKELNAESDVISTTMPKGYNLSYREILEADANCVNLHRLGPNFYRFGQHLSNMNFAESEDISQTMIDTFTQRFYRLVNFALSGKNTIITSGSKGSKLLQKFGAKKLTSASDDTLNEMIAFASNLDNWEKELLEVGQNTIMQLKSWENRDMTKVTANEMVSNLKKRKRFFDQQLNPNNHRPSSNFNLLTESSASGSSDPSSSSSTSKS